MSSEIAQSMQQILGHLVEHVPGVVGALVSSADGFAVASNLPRDADGAGLGLGPGLGPGAGAGAGGGPGDIDASGLGAMASAALALSNRLLTTVGDSSASVTHHRSPDGQVLIMPIAHLAVLTVLATSEVDASRLTAVAAEAAGGMQRLFRGVATV